MNFTKRNNSESYSPFSLRLPRFEYQAIPFAEVELVQGAACGNDYPYDRRFLNGQSEPEEQE